VDLREFTKLAVTRDYRKEYLRDHASRKSKVHRALRNRARRHSSLETGDCREVDHKCPLSRGGSGSDSNTRIVSRATNRKKGAKLKR